MMTWACGGEAGGLSDSPPALDRAMELLPAFSASAREGCAPLGGYRPPPVGTVFVYGREDGVRFSQTIDAVSGHIIESSYRPLSWAVTDVLPEENRVITQRTVAGLVSAGGTGQNGREIAFERPITDAVRSLRVGEVVSVGMTETSRFGGKTMRLTLPVVIRYEACGVLRTGEVEAPVRVYRVSTAGRSRTRGGIDSVRRSETAIYLSEREGFPLAYQGEQVTLIESKPSVGSPS